MKRKFFKTSSQGSVLGFFYSGSMSRINYMPFGYQPENHKRLSFVGQLFEAHDVYILGNGVRGYFPKIQRFMSPDSLSPFTKGELNSYAYCLADPVNRVDPSGRLSLPSIAKFAVKTRRWLAKVRPVTVGKRYAHFIEDGQRALLAEATGMRALKRVDNRYSLPDKLLKRRLDEVRDSLGVRYELSYQLSSPRRMQIFKEIFPDANSARHFEKIVLEMTLSSRSARGLEIGNWIGWPP